MIRRTTPAEPYRNLGIAFVACLFILALGPGPRPFRPGQLLTAAVREAAAGEPAATLAFIAQALEFEPALAALDTTAALFALQAGDRAAAQIYLAQARARGAEATLLSCLEAELAMAFPSEAALPLDTRCPMGAMNLEPWLAVGHDQGDLELAAVALESRLEGNPDDLRAWEGLAALTALTDPSAVESVVLRAFRAFPQGSQVLDGLLRLARADGAALSPAERAAQAGELLAAQGDWNLATAAWARALQLDPDFPVARAFLGMARSRSGGDGLPDLQRAAAEAPQDPVVRMLLGQYWLAQGDTATAIRELAFARTLDPENPALAAAFGSALAEGGKVAQAAEAYRQAAEANPRDPVFWNLLAEFSLQHELELETLGRAAARNAVALSPNDDAALSALGYIAHLNEGGPLGERLLQRAISLDPDDPLAWYRYGLLLLDQARYSEAQAALTAASILDSSGPIGRLAGRSLASLPAQYR
jgi:tetratricopeptide (TPR) repeat protein